MGEIGVDMNVNGTDVREDVEARRSLADFLREDLGKTGTHLGCEHGVCGSCVVLKDGRSVRSCLTLAVQADGSRVETVEGLTTDRAGLGRRVADALTANGGLQCGFCTPGFVVAAVELLSSGVDLDDAAVRRALSGNVCRCTGYAGIVAAVLQVHRELESSRSAGHPAAQRT